MHKIFYECKEKMGYDSENIYVDVPFNQDAYPFSTKNFFL